MTPQALAAAVFVIAIIVVIATFIVPRVTTSDAWAPQLLIVAAAALSLVAVTSALWWAERDYPESRYANASVAGRPVVALFRHVRDTRIATSGLFLQYPLFGPDLSNYVQYLGVRGRHGAFSQFRTCAAFKRAVNAGRYRYLVVTLLSFPGPTPTGTRSPELVWARSDSHLREVAQDGSGAATYRVTGALDPTSCPAGVTGDSSPSPIPIPG